MQYPNRYPFDNPYFVTGLLFFLMAVLEDMYFYLLNKYRFRICFVFLCCIENVLPDCDWFVSKKSSMSP
ncbi:unnamed protein product [Rhizophagus irregularis]|uniref:Uncharacterized protein n=1 Tax=Rhizophagus irregularis TaxID=588596 RepID=A0A916EKD1_9GLOM|nr:unnamed protein product [Rhizophagus irregularis]CAB5394974.1 unnamed protein product [Rhizophagus irregularis]CAB5395208.1 unnamed protein product [Rhizophagus irregularis]